MKLKVTREIEITDADIEDIMVSALEGGVDYWCKSLKRPYRPKDNADYFSDELTKGTGELTFVAEGKSYKLTKENFLTGLAKYLENPRYDCFYEDGIDPGNIDATCADMIVQYALFGELVYG